MTYIYGLANDVGSVALFSCQKGLSLKGQSVLTCQPNSEWDHNPPTCTGKYHCSDSILANFIILLLLLTGTIALAEFTVPGFTYLSTNQPVNPFDSASLASATYTGELSFPHPPFTVIGYFDNASGRVVFDKAINLPFGGLHLAYRVEVDLVLSQIVLSYFHGHLNEPLDIDVLGIYDAFDCILELSTSLNVTSELIIAIDIGLELEFCENCSTVCSAQAVRATAKLHQPWNIDLNGSYMLQNNVRNITLGGAIQIQGINVEVFTSIQRANKLTSISELGLLVHIPPIGVDIMGTYSRSTETAVFAGGITLEQTQLMLQMTANLSSRTLSDLEFSAALSSPFHVMLYGSYKLMGTYMSGASNITLTGLLNLTNLVLEASTSVVLTEMPRRITKLDFTGRLQSPFKAIVKATYTPSSEGRVSQLNLCGSLPIQNGSHAIALCVTLNTSSNPVSIIAFELNGMFPPPFDFIHFTGRYNSQCQCALISGTLIRDHFNIFVMTNLTFTGESTPSIDSLYIQASFHRPLDLILDGTYFYQQNTSQITLSGYFDLSELSLKTQLQLNLDGTGGFTVSTLYFMGTLPPPLNLVVGGNYSNDSMQVCLEGTLAYNFAHFQAKTKYQFRDDMHNMSAGLMDLSLHGALTNPFHLDLLGNYTFKTSQFHITGTTEVSEYLVLKAELMLSTTTTPPSLDTIMLSGVLMTPIPFEGEFRGFFDNTTRRAALTSNLNIGSVVFAAKGNLILQNNNSFLLESVEITGTTNKPLSLYVHAVYIPNDNTDLMLSGNVTLGPVHDQFHTKIHAQRDSQLNQMVIRRVYFSGYITNPFRIELSGEYQSGDTLILSGSTDLSIVKLQILGNVNLTSTPRTIASFEIQGFLKHPLRGNLSANYMPTTSSGNLVLIGRTEIADFDFTLHVYLLTSPEIAVKMVELITTFDPLSLKLIGVYDQNNQRVDLGGTLSIPTPKLNVTVTTSIDLNSETPSADTLVLSANFHKVMLSGQYNRTSQSATLHGVLTLGNLNFSAIAVLYLGDNRYLDNVILRIEYKLPFGDMLQFILEGVYNHSSPQVAVEGRVSKSGNQNSNLKAILIVTTDPSPSTQLVSLNLDELDIVSLLRTYINLSLPSGFFPLVFRNLAIYRAYTDITYKNIPYSVGFHARGEITIFTLPTIIVDASLITKPQKLFQVSLILQEAIDWKFFAICGSTCQTGPSLSVEVGSGRNRFVLSGSFHLFGTYIASVDFAVSREYISACITLSDNIRELFFGLPPKEIKIYWNSHGFTTSLPDVNLDISDFSLDDIATLDICEAFGTFISKIVITAPFQLNTTFVANKRTMAFS